MMRFHLMEISPTMASALTTESNMSRYMYITVVMSKNAALCTMMETDLQKNGKESKWNLNKVGYHISSYILTKLFRPIRWHFALLILPLNSMFTLKLWMDN